MTLSQMSTSETTDSPQHKLHWLAEQALEWSGLPVIQVRPTVFLEGAPADWLVRAKHNQPRLRDCRSIGRGTIMQFISL